MKFEPFTIPPHAFTIGLHPLGAAHPLHTDDQVQRYRDEKIALYENAPDKVVMSETNTLDAQTEVSRLIENLTGVQPDTRFSHLGPLAQTALTVQDDLLLMRRDESGWRLVAASLCFPSSWTLAEKFGHPLEKIHEPVPHMAGKMGERIRRIFDMLRPDTPLWRENWTIEADDNLRHAREIEDRGSDYKSDKIAGDLFVRSEYQTLHKLPVSGDILFTVKILVRSFDELCRSDLGKDYLRKLETDITNVSEAGLAYKGFDGNRERVTQRIAEAVNPSAVTER